MLDALNAEFEKDVDDVVPSKRARYERHVSGARQELEEDHLEMPARGEIGGR